MSAKETSATALVTMTVSIELVQPWNGASSLADIQRQARRDAEQRLAQARDPLHELGIRVGEVRTIRIVLNEETVG